MKQWVVDLWCREDGASTGLEWPLIATVLVLGSVAALVAIRHTLPGW